MTLKIFLLFYLLNIGAIANTKDIKDQSLEELLKLGQDISQPIHTQVTKQDLKYFFYTRNARNVSKNEVDKTLPIKIIIHGWLENYQNSWYDQITKEYLKKDDFLIIQFDWENIARLNYISSAINTKVVGKYLGQFLLAQKYPPENIHFVGHSLGAHVAAFAAKRINKSGGKRVHRITGLDPAGPYFRETSIQKDDLLNSDDADIVDVLHTDSGFYGYEYPLGTLDIYFNGGSRVQPGCLENLQIKTFGQVAATTFCSHVRSYKYFIESINQGSIICRKCLSLIEARLSYCQGETYTIQAETVTENLTGICAAKTNSKKPFLS